jgi:tryptophanyl-tRNA synthetase
MSKKVILTGLRANNDLHLGNYLGALLPMVELQKKYAGEYQINLFVPDLHSFTTPIDHSKLYEQTMRNLKVFVAAGLDLSNSDTYIYRQSFVPAHSELTVILNSFTYMGELLRMTQFKEKGDKQTNVSAGLFDYPVLMAADILLYGATYVPVGDDQTQHVELARDIALRMNNKFGDILLPPADVKSQLAFMQQNERLRVRDLAHPEKKMSKSDESGKGIIFLSDEPEVAAKKLMSATTDSIGVINYDYAKQPGISNLLDILASLTNQPIANVAQQYQGQTQYGPLKSAVAEAVKTFLADFQSKLTAIDEAKLMAKLNISEKNMNEIASKTLHTVQKAVGLRK